MSFPLPQTSYALTPAVAFAGMLADAVSTRMISGLADTALDAGYGLCRGAADGEVKLPGAGSDVTTDFQGVSVYLASKMPVQGSALRYAAKDSVSILRQGRIWVLALGDMVSDGPVYCVDAVANFGRFRGDNTNAALVPNAIVIKGATAGNLALIALNLP